jgi:hypothetical protein
LTLSAVRGDGGGPDHQVDGAADSVRRKVPVPALARWLLGPGIAATLAASMARGLGAA